MGEIFGSFGMITKELKANIFGQCTTEGDILSFGFADNDDYTEHLIISFSTEVDQQDEALGWTRYYLDTSFCVGAYSCIEKVSLSKEAFLFYLNPRGQKHFEVDALIVTPLFSDEERNEAISALVLVFQDEPHLVLEIVRK